MEDSITVKSGLVESGLSSEVSSADLSIQNEWQMMDRASLSKIKVDTIYSIKVKDVYVYILKTYQRTIKVIKVFKCFIITKFCFKQIVEKQYHVDYIGIYRWSLA